MVMVMILAWLDDIQCTMGKLQWEFGNRIFFIFEREIYLEYLDTDKMGGKVEKSI